MNSYARPGKLGFTANERLIIGEAGVLTSKARQQIVQAAVGILKQGLT